jgi:L-alanine-DL-glutamate epimerase-like enolase superfamily enzyme
LEITDVKTIELAVPNEARGRRYPINLVEVTTDEGITGIGEARGQAIPPGVIATLVRESLRPHLIARSPFDVEALFDTMYRYTQTVGQRGLAVIAISGVELALWDIIGKATKQPVYNLIGGRVNPAIEAYASLPGYPTVADAVHAARHYLDAGFTGIKFHQREIASSIALREAVGEEAKIMLDVSGLWTPSEAIAKARALSPAHLTWLESAIYPQDDVDGYARLTAAVGDEVPICAGENEYTIWGCKHLIAKRAVNVLNHDPIKCGGLWQAKKIAALAEVERILCAPHSACSPVGLAAALHLTTSTPNCAYAEVIHFSLAVLDGLAESIVRTPLQLRDGMIRASAEPGFGIELDEKVVDRYTTRKA